MSAFSDDFAFLQDLLRGTTEVEQGPPTTEKLRHMLIAAANEFPDNPRVLDLLDRYAFQPITGDSHEFYKASRRVCLIDRADGSESTAFLVGPDLILTAAHAMMGTAGIFANPLQVSIHFDDFMWRDGKIARGAVCALKTSVGGLQPEVVASSILLDAARTTVVDDNSLDYVLLRLDRAVGDLALPFSSRKRGWMNASFVEDRPIRGPVDVLQHPQGQLLRVGRGFIDTTPAPGKQFSYSAVTKIASSGAPILDSGKRVIGMHVAKTRDGKEQGIVFKEIFDDLAVKKIALLPPPPDGARVIPPGSARVSKRRRPEAAV
jgi:hypothetical protein